MKKYVYAFNEGNKDMRNLLGGKGANLAEMTNLGLPVPSGFTITTEACLQYQDKGKLPIEIQDQVIKNLIVLEKKTGKGFGKCENPLLVSVRSGARASMPGMMDTILNLGLNDLIVESLIKKTNNPRFVYDSYRRFIMMYANVVKGYDKDLFEKELASYKKDKKYVSDLDMTADDFKIIVAKFKNIYLNLVKEKFPLNPIEQLMEAVKAVFRSWNNDRAKYYRELNNIPESWGTAVNVQEMVFGNMGESSATGVAFTRNPSTGENQLFGEFLINAQGEDVVAGVRTPLDISKLKEAMPSLYDEFAKISKRVEKYYKDMQDMEFTIETGKLFILQTRNGKRSPEASLKIAIDLVNSHIINKKEALLMVDPLVLDGFLHERFTNDALKKAKVIGKGLAASPGAAKGKIYFDPEKLIKEVKNGEEAILVRKETSPEDIEAMNKASGVLTLTGGMTSHAAVVARGMGICCVVGASSFKINNKELILSDGTKLKEKTLISLNGNTGEVYSGFIDTEEGKLSDDFNTFMKWANTYKRLEIRCNADTPKDALVGKNFGAKGIGLCRTEHMFFEENRIFNFRKMILAKTVEEREKALAKILPYQRNDFEALFRCMSPYPVIIRYLDPPLHEFLPKTSEEITSLAESLKISNKEINNRIEDLKEFNPMMGHRGVRLSITYPEIAIMQTRAIIEAAIKVSQDNIKVCPEIMIPLIGSLNEFTYLKKLIKETADSIIKESNQSIKYKIGTMIEVPRGAIISKKLSQEADFYSFGTNDLTQMTYGFSRDDASKFLTDYYAKNIFLEDPFKSIDEEGVGFLMKLAIKESKKTNKKISLGICGEHGGDPKSITFCNQIGLDYVSCSPYRVPVATLAAAQAEIKKKAHK